MHEDREERSSAEERKPPCCSVWLTTSARYCRIPGLLVETLLLQSCSNAAHAVLCSHSDQNTLSYTNYSVSICHASVGAYSALAVIIVVAFHEFSAFQFIERFRMKGRRRLIPKLNRTANSLISISNDGPNNHTYKNLCLNELAKFPRHHRCFYELWESHSG